MGFEALLGNERLKENLSSSISRGHISHFYLISGPAGSGKRTLSRLLAAAIMCRGAQKPCFSCPACRKVMADTHPDVITVDDPEKKTVSVDLIRKAREDMFIRPNEAEKKIYIFPRAQDMRVEAQNALLKVLEEPPAYGVFLLLTDNEEKLLATVRSRCTELTMNGLPVDMLRQQLKRQFPEAAAGSIEAAVIRSGGYLGQALTIMEEGGALSPQTEGFAQSYATKDAVGLLRVLAPMEKWKRDQVLPELYQWLQILQGALICRNGMAVAAPMAEKVSVARSANELMDGVRHLEKAIEYIQGNVSVAAVCGYLEWALR